MDRIKLKRSTATAHMSRTSPTSRAWCFELNCEEGGKEAAAVVITPWPHLSATQPAPPGPTTQSPATCMRCSARAKPTPRSSRSSSKASPPNPPPRHARERRERSTISLPPPPPSVSSSPTTTARFPRRRPPPPRASASDDDVSRSSPRSRSVFFFFWGGGLIGGGGCLRRDRIAGRGR